MLFITNEHQSIPTSEQNTFLYVNHIGHHII